MSDNITPHGNKRSRPPPTLKAPKLWDQPKSAVKGDKDSSAIFQAVGSALTSWEIFESYFGLVFGQFVGDRDRESAAMRAYGSVLTFRGRREMTDAASEAYFASYPNTKEEDDFNDLSKAAIGFSARRNEIAHGVVQKRFGNAFVLLPSYYATNKHKLGKIDSGDVPRQRVIAPTYIYSSVQIRLLDRRFKRLAYAAMKVSVQLYNEKWRRKAKKKAPR